MSARRGPPWIADWNDGDIIGFSGSGIVADAINIGTYGLPRRGLSHIGIIGTWHGRQYIFESTTLNGDKPCAIMKQPIAGVQAHPLGDLSRRDGKVWRYPLASTLSPTRLKCLRFLLLSYLGTPYDMRGAVRSAGFFLRILRGILRKQEISELFCSELVAQVLTGVKIAAIKNVSSQSPNSLVRYLNRRHIYKKRVRIK